jgi:alkylation response protein AidB-like acyl-CoA dehydrogenase
MDFALTESQPSLKRQNIEFAGSNLNEGLPERERAGRSDRNLRDLCGKERLQDLAVPGTCGGKRLDAFSTVIAMEGLGYGCEDNGLSFSMAVHYLACVTPVWLHG